MPLFDVTLRIRKEITFEVEADDQDKAISEGIYLYENDEILVVAVNEDVVEEGSAEAELKEEKAMEEGA